MSQEIFRERIARIESRSGGACTAAAASKTAVSKTAAPTRSGMAQTRHRASAAPGAIPSAGHPSRLMAIKLVVMGALSGLVAGTLAAGLEDPTMPWGPEFAYHEMLLIPVLLALCAGPVMAIAAAALRARFPGFFRFAVAYFPCVIGAALLDLPLF